ncbi:hypothetical protein SBM3_00019 [Synechococcus phage S-BM3]|nr:hypothetical protein SBM3_00019 [Synechococcus phage S-BM3]
MLELPYDFPHQPPDNYRYETVRHKTNVDAIFLVSNFGWIYSGGDQCRTIWGFVKHKRTKRSSSHTYHAPINANKVGAEVSISDTRPWTAMQINYQGLEQFFM